MEKKNPLPPFFSVIIPTYNRLKKTNQALESVLAQVKPIDSLHPFYDCWVVDDGSEPSFSFSLKLKENFYCRGIALHLLRNNQNKGVAQARNQGIRASSGDWVAFLDSDDLWKKDKLIQQHQFIQQFPNYNILQCEESWFRHGKLVNSPLTFKKKSGYIFKACLEKCMITPSSVVIRRNLIKKGFFFNEAFPACEDYELWLRITLEEKVGLIKKKLLIRHAGHSDQLSFRFSIMDRFRLKALRIIKKKTIQKKYWQETKWVNQIFLKKIKIILQGAWKRKRYFFYLHYKIIQYLYFFSKGR